MNNPLNVVDPSALCCDSNDSDCSLCDSSSSLPTRELTSATLCIECVTAAAGTCGAICAEDPPVWDDPEDTCCTCMNKCFRTALALCCEPPKDVAVIC